MTHPPSLLRIRSLISDDSGREGEFRMIVDMKDDVTTIAFPAEGTDALDILAFRTAAERRFAAAIITAMCRALRQPA